MSSTPPALAQSAGTALLLPIGASHIQVSVPDHMRPIVRQELRRISRNARLEAGIAENAERLANTIGAGVGGTLATSGIVAIAVASGPVGIAGFAMVALGVMVAGGGMWAAHKQANVRVTLQHRADAFRDAAEELI